MPTTTCANSPAAAPRLPLGKSGPLKLDAGPMIIGCPVCRTRYLVDEQALGGRAGRTVRCASCGHTWHQKAPPELDTGDDSAWLGGSRIEPALEVPPRPGVISEPRLEIPLLRESTPELPLRPGRRRWGAIRWLVLLVLLALAILVGVFVARRAVVAM